MGQPLRIFVFIPRVCITSSESKSQLVNESQLQAADDAAAAKWFPVTQLPPLAFDHKLVVRECLSKACDIPEAAGMQTALQEGIKLLAGDWKTQSTAPV